MTARIAALSSAISSFMVLLMRLLPQRAVGTGSDDVDVVQPPRHRRAAGHYGLCRSGMVLPGTPGLIPVSLAEAAVRAEDQHVETAGKGGDGHHRAGSDVRRQRIAEVVAPVPLPFPRRPEVPHASIGSDRDDVADSIGPG